MGSKKWTSIGSVVGALVGGGALETAILGSAIGAGAGYTADHYEEKKKDSGGVAATQTAATESEAQKEAAQKGAADGGESPFASGALATKKKKSTLLSGGQVGALSGAGGSSTMLGE